MNETDGTLLPRFRCEGCREPIVNVVEARTLRIRVQVKGWGLCPHDVWCHLGCEDAAVAFLVLRGQYVGRGRWPDNGK